MLAELIAFLRQEGSPRTASAELMAFAREYYRDWMRQHLFVRVRAHPLGFFHGVEPLADGLRLRFHLWADDWRLPEDQSGGDVHDHVFELNSLVLMGALSQKTFRFEPRSEGAYEVLTVQYGAAKSHVGRTGEIGELIETTNERYGSGSAYRLKSNVIHQVRPQQTPAATLVLAVPNRELEHPRIISRAGATPVATFERVLVEPERSAPLERALAQLLK